MDLISIRMKLNQLIIEAFENYILNIHTKIRVCSSEVLPNDIFGTLYHFDDICGSDCRPSWNKGRVTCNKCNYFNDYDLDCASFIID